MAERVSEARAFSHPRTNTSVLDLVAGGDLRGVRILDVGAGEGHFAGLVAERAARAGLAPGDVVQACDLNPDLFRVQGVSCVKADAHAPLPFPDDTFDAACSIEVIEHLEDQFAFVRELRRVVAPGGRAIVTTPNVLNVNSRLRFLTSGFGLLFDPLPLRAPEERDAVHADTGHVHPVSAYFLAYIFHRAGFRSVTIRFDRHKASAFGWLAVVGLPIVVGGFLSRRRLKRRRPAIASENAALLDTLNSLRMLTARSVIVVGVK